MWRNKKVVVAVSGGIAAYKACILVSRLRQAGAEVKVAMTKTATSFVSSECFAALAGSQVYTDLWDQPSEIPHIKLGQEADIVVVAPATANIMAKIAHGIADDLVSTMLLAATAPVLIVPAMNDAMWDNPANQANLAQLAGRGIRIVNPSCGNLACGSVGKGRFPEVEIIMDEMAALLTRPSLEGRRVLITAGPTREFIDPVRFLSNPSTGMMGLEIAKAAWQRGAKVTLVLGPTSVQVPSYIDLVPIVSAREMFEAVKHAMATTDVLFMTAAVADYRPLAEGTEKIKKTESDLSAINLTRNPDILLEVKALRQPGQTIVGFAAETGADLDALAERKLNAKGMDFIVANAVYKTDKGFGCPVQSRVVILGRDGSRHVYEEITKTQLAQFLCDMVSEVNEG